MTMRNVRIAQPVRKEMPGDERFKKPANQSAGMGVR